MITTDNLIDPKRREITTVFVTTQRVDEGTYDAGTVQLALTTSHDKDRKRFQTVLNREVRTDSGFITRRFTLYAGPSADAGIRLATEPAPRFNANKARNLHDFVLANLDELLAADSGDVAPVLAGLLDNARQLV